MCHLHYKCSNERADSCRGREEEQCDLARFGIGKSDRDPDSDVFICGSARGKARTASAGSG